METKVNPWPARLDYHLQMAKEELAELEKQFLEIADENIFFEQRRVKNITNTEIRQACIKLIKMNNEALAQIPAKIAIAKAKIKEFEDLKLAYIEDEKRGVVYDN